MLKNGERAPDFALPDQHGHTVTLGDLLKAKAVVIYFYPKDHTPGCTQQSCSFRDNYGAYKKLGAEIVGVSADSSTSHEGFAKAHNLPFPLLSDHNGEVAKHYDVKKTLGIFKERVTYVIDSDGVIRYALSSQFNIAAHVDKTLEVVKALAS